MPRKPRLHFEGAFYHVTTRGNNQQKIFFNDSDRKKYLYFLRKAKEKFHFRLHAYILMQNHVHLIIETSEQGTISEIMHWLNTNYTKYFNWAHEKIGHLFQGRFHSALIDKDAYLLEVSRYVHLNPVRAGLLKHPKNYKWSSYSIYINGSEDNFIEKNLILSMISDKVNSHTNLYREFVETGIGEDSREFREKLYKGLLQPK